MDEVYDVTTILKDIHELHETLRDANVRVSLAEAQIQEAFEESKEQAVRTQCLGTAWVALEDCWEIADDIMSECEDYSEILRKLILQLIQQ